MTYTLYMFIENRISFQGLFSYKNKGLLHYYYSVLNIYMYIYIRMFVCVCK